MQKKSVSDIAFTEAVKQAQRQRGSRKIYETMERGVGWKDTVDEFLTNFLAQRDFFYFGTASSNGRPYIQYRGGPDGFVKVFDPKTLAFADFAGNRQYISLGNLSENNQAFMFFIDYPTRTRIKLWGQAEFIEDDPQLLARLVDPAYEAPVERALVFHLQAWDVNCRKHIQERWTQKELENVLGPLRQKLADLESENARLRAEIAQLKDSFS
jgi:hypothetical protein